MYYLQSRYYDPQIGRFINADQLASTGQGFIGYNMFAYCGNNPTARIDRNGEMWELALAGTGGIGLTVGAAFSGSIVPQLSLGVIISGITSITPVGWITIGVVTVAVVIAVGIHYGDNPALSTSDSDADSKARSQYPPARRNRYNTKKEAKEAARRAGGGKPPKHHPKRYHGNKCPHYHPDVPATHRTTPHIPCSHDHYYYPG